MTLDRDTRRAGVAAATKDKPEVLLPRSIRIAALVAAAVAAGVVVVFPAAS